MMTAPTHDSPGDHPYRTAPEPRSFDPESGRVPYDGQTRMRLTIASGLAHARIVVDPAARDLLAIQAGPGPAPRLRLNEGELTLSWHVSLREWLCSVLSAGSVFTSGFAFNEDFLIVLHPAVEWSLAIHGGISHVACDLAAGSVDRIDIAGGVSHLLLDLPQPSAIVPVRIAGGASHLGLRRPAEAGVTVGVDGGIAKLQLDERKFGAIGGAAQLDTRNFIDGAPHYAISIDGGACDLAVERR